MKFYTFVQQTCLENIVRVSYKSQTTGVLGQHSLSLVCGSRRDLEKVAWSLDKLECGSAHVSWVPMGRLAFKPLPWSRSSPDVWDISAALTPLGALPSHWSWGIVIYRERAGWNEARTGLFLESAGKDPDLLLVHKSNADVWCLPQ